jgi:hypothetical protein
VPSAPRRPPRAKGPMEAYWRAIRLTNETGLAGRKDYEISFQHLGAEVHAECCGAVPFYRALIDAGVPCAGWGTVGLYPPDEDLPGEIWSFLLEADEVVEASATQVLAMREAGGARAEQFSPEGRQQLGILMVGLGDVVGSRVRRSAWTSVKGEMRISDFALEKAREKGWSRVSFEQLHRNLPDLVPSAQSKVVRDMTCDRQEGGPESECCDPPWITYEHLAQLIEEAPRRKRSNPVRSGR